jgi:hypothetical protein
MVRHDLQYRANPRRVFDVAFAEQDVRWTDDLAVLERMPHRREASGKVILEANQPVLDVLREHCAAKRERRECAPRSQAEERSHCDGEASESEQAKEGPERRDIGRTCHDDSHDATRRAPLRFVLWPWRPMHRRQSKALVFRLIDHVWVTCFTTKVTPATLVASGSLDQGVAASMTTPNVARRSVAENLSDILDSPEVAQLVDELEATRSTGRPGYPLRTMIGMALAKSMYAIPTVRVDGKRTSDSHFLGFFTMTPVVKPDLKTLPTTKRTVKKTGISTMTRPYGDPSGNMLTSQSCLRPSGVTRSQLICSAAERPHITRNAGHLRSLPPTVSTSIHEVTLACCSRLSENRALKIFVTDSVSSDRGVPST